MSQSETMNRREFFGRAAASVAVVAAGGANMVDAELVRPNLHDNSIKAYGLGPATGLVANWAAGLAGFIAGAGHALDSADNDRGDGVNSAQIQTNMTKRALFRNAAAFAASRVSHRGLTDRNTSFRTTRNMFATVPSTFASAYGLGTSFASMNHDMK